MTRDLLVLGGASGQLWQPDALEDHQSAAESDVPGRLLTKAYAPVGTIGETVFRRIDVTGYHRDQVRFEVVPLVDGRFLTDLRAIVVRPHPKRGRPERFHFEVSLTREHPELAGVRIGVRGSVIQAYISWKDPTSTFHVETVDFVHDAITGVRSRRAG